ncbi:MAG: hypothetical protein R2932_46165 [Caldilineaceae bacterium]
MQKLFPDPAKFAYQRQALLPSLRCEVSLSEHGSSGRDRQHIIIQWFRDRVVLDIVTPLLCFFTCFLPAHLPIMGDDGTTVRNGIK